MIGVIGGHSRLVSLLPNLLYAFMVKTTLITPHANEYDSDESAP